MEAVQKVVTNPELVETILNLVPVSDLVNSALVNWTWNEEAVKVLNRKAIVKLDFNKNKISSYVDMIRVGGRCHDQILLNCLGRKYGNARFQGRYTVTSEEFEAFLSAVGVFGGSKIKRLIVKMEFGNGTRTPEQFQPLFTASQNVECLKVEYKLLNRFTASSTLSCFPEGISLDCLKDLDFCFESFEFITNENENEKTGKRIVITKLVEISQNLAELRGATDIVGMFLDEMGKTPGRLEKIVLIDTYPTDRVPSKLMNYELPNLKILYLAITSGTINEVVPILERYKDILVELRLSLVHGEGDVEELTLPKSMRKLKKLHVKFTMCSHCEYEGSENYPILKFPTPADHDSHDEDSGDGGFYPNLINFIMGGNRHRQVLMEYLAVMFPDSLNNSIFTSVQSLHFAKPSMCDGFLEDGQTVRRLMHYFPNAEFESELMVDNQQSVEFDSYDWSDEDFSSVDSDD